jgi:competence protein ComGC
MKIGIALLLLVVTVAHAADDAEKGCRARLKNLGGAAKAYQIIHGDKPPAKISDLYSDGLVNSLDDFICPASGTNIKVASEIDSKSDYTFEPLPDAKDMIVREKNPRHGANTVLAIFADNSIKALPAPAGSTAAVTPATTTSPAPAAKATASAMPSPTADGGLVVVPNLGLFDSVSKMKEALTRVGLVGSFSAKGKPPLKAMEFKFASQLPLADTKVKPGSKVEVFIYQRFEEATTGVTGTPSTAASATPATEGDEVVVPNLAQFDTVPAMKAALERVGLKGHFSAKGKPPSRELEFKFASQLPLAETKAKRGSMVVVFIYQKFEESSGPATTSSPSPSSSAPPAPPLGPSTAWVRRESGDPTSNLEGAKWMGSWRGKVTRMAEAIAGGGTGDYEEFTLIRRRDGSEVWIHGSAPLFWYEVGNGKVRFKTKDTTPPRYAELEQRGDHWAGRWVEGDRVLATFDLAPIPKPKWLTNF